MTPEQIEKLAERNKYISTPEILRDITDTQKEIEAMEQQIARRDLRVDLFKDTYTKVFRIRSRKERLQKSIGERKQFISQLQAIIEYRKSHGE